MPKTLLLADDSVTIQKVVGISFASEDIEIITVDNGRDAVAKARTVRPDIILADVVMPAMSGYEVCEAIKADPNLRHVPVLLLTGTFEAFDEARAAAVGAAGHVAKPFEAQTLVDRVKHLLASAPAPVSARPASAPVRPAPASAPPPASSLGGLRPPAVSLGDEVAQRVSAQRAEGERRPSGGTPAPPRAGDDAFDFFSDEADDIAVAPRAEPAGALDLEEPDAAFAFGDDDLASDIPEPIPAAPLAPAGRRLDATVAMLPDPPAATAAAGDGFEFSFDGDGTGALDEPIDPDQLGHTALLDPPAAASFDVSSSDLGAVFPSDTAAPTEILSADFDGAIGASIPPDFAGASQKDAQRGKPQVARSEPKASEDHRGGAQRAEGERSSDEWVARSSSSDWEADLDLAEPDPFEEPAPAARSSRDPVMDLLTRKRQNDEPRWTGEPVAAADDLGDRARPFGVEPDPGDTLRRRPAGAAAATAIWDAPAGPPDDDPLEATPIGVEPVVEATDTIPPMSAGPDLSPAMRRDLHDTIEKIAWDAFSQVTEKIVRQAIERVEQVAWEIVPKLAETLILEEIRRLKDGSDQ